MKALLFLLTATAAFAADAPLLKDDFSDPKLEQRRASRGDWKFADNTATCTQDDELYKKNKDHGPILFYDLAYTDAAIRFAVKPDAANKTLVFTANGAEGHIFRIVFSATGASIRAFPPDEKDHKSIALGTEPTLKLKPGEWTNVSVELRGPKATVKAGEFTQTYEHASIARAKTNLSVGFSFGTVSVKNVMVEN
ncbi:MAG: hypothetical protein ACKVY0_20715 [Prosthecobacter sp.]|uniref:hypothetical protein n=1 Tax=Prosthecobacter sp. TaxID=1965333 RepID=UPI003900F389